jgi:hypothetical protein
VNRPPAALHNGADRRIQQRPHTLEAKLVLVKGERPGNVCGGELRRDPTHHGRSLAQPRRRGAETTGRPACATTP